MKKILLILFIVTLTSCQRDNVKSKPTGLIDRRSELTLYELDSCEYLGISIRDITHKGNCKFCNKRLENLIKKYHENN